MEHPRHHGAAPGEVGGALATLHRPHAHAHGGAHLAEGLLVVAALSLVDEALEVGRYQGLAVLII